MGKISVTAAKTKKDDVVGLITPIKSKPGNNAPRNSEPAQQPPSPTPKRPLTAKKSGCCCRLCLFSLGIFVVLLMCAAVACFIDYQQGNLEAHAIKMQDDLKETGKYVVEVLYQTPKDLHRIFDGSLNWTKKNTDTQHDIKNEVFKNDDDQEGNALTDDGNDDGVEGGLQGVTQFLVGILNDVTSVFQSISGQANDTIPPSNLITRGSPRPGKEPSANLENEDSEIEAIEVIEEEFLDGDDKKHVDSGKEAFGNLLNNRSHLHK